MADYRIVCTYQVEADPELGHRHVIALGVRSNETFAPITIQAAIARIARGDRFYTTAEKTNVSTYLEALRCPCGHFTIQSAQHTSPTGDVDELPWFTVTADVSPDVPHLAPISNRPAKARKS